MKESVKILRMWSKFKEEVEKPLCNICNRQAIGTFWDREFNTIHLCEMCNKKLNESLEEEKNERANNNNIR